MNALLGSSFSGQRQTGRHATTHTHALAHQLHISKIYAAEQTVKKLLEGWTGKFRCQNESFVKALTSTFFLPSGVLARSGTIRSSREHQRFKPSAESVTIPLLFLSEIALLLIKSQG